AARQAKPRRVARRLPLTPAAVSAFKLKPNRRPLVGYIARRGLLCRSSFGPNTPRRKQSEIVAEGAHYRMAVRRQLGNTAGSRGRIGISWQRISVLSTGREWPGAATGRVGGHC